MAVRFPDMPQSVDTAETHIDHFVDHLISCLNQRRLVLLSKARDTRHEMAARPEAPETRGVHSPQFKDGPKWAKGIIGRDIWARGRARVTQGGAMALVGPPLGTPLPETRLVFQGECEQLEKLILDIGNVVVIPRYEYLRKVVVGKKGRNPGELSWTSGVAVDENSNHIYVTEYDPARVSIFSESGEFLNAFTHEHMKQPFGIAIHRNNVYVSDWGAHGVFHFKIEADMRLDAELVGEGSADGKFDLPHQLTVSANGDVFVADFLNHRVQILDESLHFQRSIKHDSMRLPRDVKLTNNEVFVLTESSPCVTVFSHAGEKIRSFITRGEGMQVARAWLFCLDALNNLIISDRGTNSVKIFSPDGSLLHSIGGFQDDYVSPKGLALTKPLKLVVIAPNDTFMLQIFS